MSLEEFLELPTTTVKAVHIDGKILVEIGSIELLIKEYIKELERKK